MKVNPEENGVDVKSIRQTEKEELLLEIGRRTTDNTAFTEAVRVAIGDKGIVKKPSPMTTIEIRDIDSVSTTDDVKAALKLDLSETVEIRCINLTRPTYRGQCAAFCEIDKTSMTIALEKARIRIGWVNCLIRPIIRAVCCKCLDYDYQLRNCKETDRSKCYKCAGEDYKAVDCDKSPNCFLRASQESTKDSLGPTRLQIQN